MGRKLYKENIKKLFLEKHMNNHKNLEEFLGFTIGQNEVSLVILGNNNEKANVLETFKKKGFSEAETFFDLMVKISETGKYFLFLTDDNCKNAYDFACQYPMGRIEIFNPEKMQAIIKNPIYKNSAIVFVANRKSIEECQKQGLNILSKAGLTQQVD